MSDHPRFEGSTEQAMEAAVAAEYEAESAAPVAALGTAPQPSYITVELLNEAKAIVRASPLYRRFIDGTPLENDLAVWMADFAAATRHEHTAHVAEFLNELYALMVDPCAEGTLTVAEMQSALVAAAIRDRDKWAAGSAETPHPPQIDCPLCGLAVKQVSSATLSLALWQHFNWMHTEAGVVPPPASQPVEFGDWMNDPQAFTDAQQERAERAVAQIEKHAEGCADQPTPDMVRAWGLLQFAAAEAALSAPPASPPQVEENARTVASIAAMLGWMNIPPRETLERDIAALKSRASSSVALAQLREGLQATISQLRKAYDSTDARGSFCERHDDLGEAQFNYGRARELWDTSKALAALLAASDGTKPKP